MVIDETEPLKEEEMWFRKRGFFNNPFSIKPLPYDNKIFGYKDVMENLFYLIPRGSIVFVEGELGTGKTSILKHLIVRYRGRKRVIFFSAGGDEQLDIERLLRNRYGFWGRLFRLMPRNMIVLLDEAMHLTPENTERVKYFFDQGNIKTVVFTGLNYKKTELHPSIKERIGPDGLVGLTKLTYDEAVELIKNRLGDDNILSEEMIKKLYYIGNFNPRKLLQNCDIACKYVVDNDLGEVKEIHLRKLFKSK